MTNITELMKERYEREIGEPWSALESRVRARHPELFKLLDDARKIDLSEREYEKRKGWRFW